MIVSETGAFVEITKELKIIRRSEPYTKGRSVTRAAIIFYEFGSGAEYLAKEQQKNLPDPIKKGLGENAKLGMADTLIQCQMICLDHGWDFDEIRILGLEHLKERKKDFAKEGYGW